MLFLQESLPWYPNFHHNKQKEGSHSPPPPDRLLQCGRFRGEGGVYVHFSEVMQTLWFSNRGWGESKSEADKQRKLSVDKSRLYGTEGACGRSFGSFCGRCVFSSSGLLHDANLPPSLFIKSPHPLPLTLPLWSCLGPDHNFHSQTLTVSFYISLTKESNSEEYNFLFLLFLFKLLNTPFCIF